MGIKRSLLIRFMIILLFTFSSLSLKYSLIHNTLAVDLPELGNYSENSDSNSTETIGTLSNTTLYDSVDVYAPGNTLASFNLTLRHNFIYYILLESYVPYVDNISIDVWLKTPSYLTQHFFRYPFELENNKTKVYFEFCAAENGTHILEISIASSQWVNLHLQIIEEYDIVYFFQDNSVHNINPNYPYLAEVLTYNSAHLNQTFVLPVEDDTEYWIDFFRVSPLSKEDTGNVFVDPKVSLTLYLGNASYPYYPNVESVGYVLNTNMGDPVKMLNETFYIRFGSYMTGKLIFNLSMEDHPYNMNYAFIAYASIPIGNGTDDLNNSNDSEEYNSTFQENSYYNESTNNSIIYQNNSSNQNSQEEDEDSNSFFDFFSDGSAFDSWFNNKTSEWRNSISNWAHKTLSEYYDYVVFSIASTIGLSILGKKYRWIKRVPQGAFRVIREFHARI